MKKIYVIIVLMLCSLFSFSQNIDSVKWTSQESSLFVGYNYNVGGGDAMHIFELGYKESDVADLFGTVSSSTYYSCDFIFGKNRTTIGPTIGTYAAAWLMALGGEFSVFTDFSGATIALTPYLGFGSKGGRLTLQFPITLYHHNLDYLNTVSLHLSFPIYHFDRRRGSINKEDKSRNKNLDGIYM